MGIFRNEQYQKSLDENGYLILPIIDLGVVQAINEIYRREFVENDNPTYAFNAESEASKTDSISKELINYLEPCLDKELVNYINNGGTFFTKQKKHGELPLHQDTTVVHPGRGYYTWIPLQDVNEENGCLFLIEKSHLFFNNYISFTYTNSGIPAKEIEKRYIKKIEMKVGEILFFSGRMFHGSYENKTDKARVAVNVLITQKNEQLVYYQKKDDETASEYFVTAESYKNSYKTYSTGLLPEGAVFSKDIPYKHIMVDSAMLTKCCAHESKPANSFFSWLTQLFA